MLSPWLRLLKPVKRHQTADRRRRNDYRLFLEGLEARRVLSTTGLGAIEGTVYVDDNANGVFDAG